MAVGINQVGGNGGNITFEDNANADALGDGRYSLADFKAKSDAGAWKAADGVTPAIEKLGNKYLIHCNLVNGDGALTNVTTWYEVDTNFEFDSAKTYSVSATGRANRFTEWGALVDGTKDSARQGVDALFAASTNIQGNGKIYGSKLKTSVGNILLAPGQTGLAYSVVNCILYAVTGACAVGLASVGSVDVAYNIDITGGSAAIGAINNWGSVLGERVTVALNTAGTYHIRTNSIFSIKDTVFIGIGPGTGGQLRVGGAGTELIAPTWEQGIGITDATHSALVNEWWPYNVVVTDGSALPIAGLPFTLTDGFGATVVNTTTTAAGQIMFGSGNTANCVKVVTYPAGLTHTYQGPWTARVNQGAGANPSYPQRTILFDFPVVATWLTTNVQYGDMFDIIQLIPPGGLPSQWQERIAPYVGPFP